MDLLKPLVALLAIVNPIGVGPFFIPFTQNFAPEQPRHTTRISAFSAFVVMTRLMGLILAAMAVELLADGLVKLFPVLATPVLR